MSILVDRPQQHAPQMERRVYFCKRLIFHQVLVRRAAYLKANVPRKWAAKTSSWAKGLNSLSRDAKQRDEEVKNEGKQNKTPSCPWRGQGTMIGAAEWTPRVISKAPLSPGRPLTVRTVPGGLESAVSGLMLMRTAGDCGPVLPGSPSRWPWASSRLVQASGMSLVHGWGRIRSFSWTYTLDAAKTVPRHCVVRSPPSGAHSLGGNEP